RGIKPIAYRQRCWKLRGQIATEAHPSTRVPNESTKRSPSGTSSSTIQRSGSCFFRLSQYSQNCSGFSVVCWHATAQTRCPSRCGIRSYAAASRSLPQHTIIKVPASRSPFAITVAKPPTALTARISAPTSACTGSRGSGSGIDSVAGQARQSDMRARERSRSAADLITFAVDQARFRHEDPAPAAHPPALGEHLSAPNGLRKVQIKGRRQQKTVADH